MNTARIAATEKTGTAAADSSHSRNPVRIWVDGCYDVMHHGHFNALRQAKAMGDIIVAGVHSDAELLLHKGPPVMNEQERIAAVAACKWVDEVVPNAPYLTSLEWMDRYSCDFCVHGDDVSTLADGSDSYKHVKDVGRYRECKRTKGVSTTDLVSRMLTMTQDQQQQPTQSDQDHTSTASLEGRTADDVTTDGSEERGSDNDTIKCKGINTINGTKHGNNSESSDYHVLATARKIGQFLEGNKEPKKGDKVVYVDGGFDLFHVGHIEFLRRARAMGDYLVVGVHDDQTVEAIKGDRHPLLSLHERVLSVLACRYVNDVVIGAPYNVTDQVLDGDYGVDVVVRGATTASNDTNGQDPCRIPKQRGIFVQLDQPPHPVTTESIVHRILVNRNLYEERQRRKAAKEAAAALAHPKEDQCGTM
ncbi:Ethanolamine-phosphate cytidylyltransferase [Dissophora ornata]|nr:Ethanolamine-phosphate cytidylyltransferase [Dissophora ornata]